MEEARNKMRTWLSMFFLLIAFIEVINAQNIYSVAGNGTGGFSGDGGAANLAKLNLPAGVALDSSGNLFIADQFNNRIRKVSVSGIITTVAGTGVAGYNGDGGPANQAQL